MSVTITHRLDYAAWTRGLATTQERAENLPPALRAIARAGVASTRRRFQAGRGPDGQAWPKSRKTSGQTMIASGLLLRSISDRPPEATAVEWGSNRSYAALRQFGFSGQVSVSAHSRVVRKLFGRPLKEPVTQQVRAHDRKVDEPARPFLGISTQDYTTFSRILLRHVTQPLVGGPGAEGGEA